MILCIWLMLLSGKGVAATLTGAAFVWSLDLLIFVANLIVNFVEIASTLAAYPGSSVAGQKVFFDKVYD